MCEGDGHELESELGGALGVPSPYEEIISSHDLGMIAYNRREFMGRAAAATGLLAAAVSGLLPGSFERASASSLAVAKTAGLDGTMPYRTAQHIHGSHSEGVGSMTAQATEAAKHVEALWFSDHDWREAGIGSPNVIHFNSLTAETLPGPNPAWQWKRHDSGSLDGASSGGIDTVDVSPNDPDHSGALYARAISTGDASASLSFYSDDSKLRNSMRTPASGQNWAVEVKLREASADSWGFMRVALSYHPAKNGRPDAYNFIEYRFGPFPQRAYSLEQLDLTNESLGDSGDAGNVTLRPGEKALLGVVWVPQAPGSYETQTMNFTDDIAQLFPGMIARDNSIRGAWFGATSNYRQPANACFDYLRMNRVRGQAQFENRQSITEEMAPQFPGLAIYNASEVSYGGGHRHWLGGNITLSAYYGTNKASGAPSPSNEEFVSAILASGGMPIANHPFGTNGKKLTDAAAAAKGDQIVEYFKQTNAEGGLQGLEIFYRSRGGASLEQHWRLGRTAIRNYLPLTFTGVSDNHWGRVNGWEEEANHFVTGIYADSLNELDLIDAQRRGRAYAAEIKSYEGQLDLSLDDLAVMGQIDVRPGVVTRQLNIMATSLPKKGVVEVWRVPIDGSMDGEPGGVIEVLPASAFAHGIVSLTVDATYDSAFAVMVGTQKTSTAPIKRIGGSNPIWHLTQEPTAWTIPENRRAS